MLGLSSPVAAQSVEEDSQSFESVLALERPGYEPRRIKLGAVTLAPQLDVSAIYNSNVYAANTDRVDDVVAYVSPRLIIEEDSGRLQWQAMLNGEFRRYASNSQENSDSYGASGTVAAYLNKNLTINAAAGYRRLVENRADPEVRQGPNLGPPIFDVLSGELRARIEGGKTGVTLRAQAEKYNFLSSANDDRDFSSYRGTVRVSRRLSPAFTGFVQAYVNQRDFRIRDPLTNANRDGRTVGGMVGVEINPGGRLRGDIAAGVFRYKPKSSAFQSFSGFALEGSLVYSPRERTAFILDVFSGDVATIRNGASGRVDRSARLTVQQEVRHNLIASAALRYRQTRYRGIDNKLNTLGAEVDIEYLLNRHLSVALMGEYTKRTSGSDADEFDRARVGVSLRMRY